MDIEQLLEKLDDAETDEELQEVGEQLLEADPNSPYGKLAVWQAMDYDESLENLDMLREALDSIRAIVEAKEEPANIETDRDAQTYCAVMMNLGYSLLAKGEREETLEIAREFADFDDEEYFPNRTLLYRCMLDLQMYTEILDTLETDMHESVAGEHARVISMIETKADEGLIRDAMNYAFSLAPDVPFYILNIWDMPEKDEDIDEDTEDAVSYATYLAEPWCANDARIAVLSAPTFMFGYLTDRLDDEKEIKTLEEGYEGAGVLDDLKAAKTRLNEMSRVNKDIEEIDSSALGETAQILEKMASLQ
jgi:hypothetical protein